MEPTAEEIHEHIDKFTDIYAGGKVVADIPEGIRVTVWCEGRDESGFAIDVTTGEMGIESFIAKKWIIHEDLKKMLNEF